MKTGKQPISRERYDELQQELREAEERVRAFRDAEGSSGWSDAAAGAQINAAIAPLITRVLELERLLKMLLPLEEDALRKRLRTAAVDDMLSRAEDEAAMFRLEIANGHGERQRIAFPDGPFDPNLYVQTLSTAERANELRVIRVGEQGEPDQIVFRWQRTAG